MSGTAVPGDARPQRDSDDDTVALAALQDQIATLQRTLNAIGGGSGIDAVVLGEDEQEQVYTLTSSADRPYRVIVENMGEGAMTVSEHGVVLYANPQVASFLGVERGSMAGSSGPTARCLGASRSRPTSLDRPLRECGGIDAAFRFASAGAGHRGDDAVSRAACAEAPCRHSSSAGRRGIRHASGACSR